MKLNSTFKTPLICLTLMATTSSLVAQTVTDEGPAPFELGQSEAINANQVGAVNALAAHPTDPDILYIGTVNGGV